MKRVGGSTSNHNSSFELSDEEEKRLRAAACRYLVNACEAGTTSWDSDPVRIANLLKEANDKFGWEIPIDMDDIKKKLKKTDDEIKGMSKLYQEQHHKAHTTEDNSCQKKSTKRRKCTTSSSSSSSSSPKSDNARSENHVKKSDNIQAVVVGGGREAEASVSFIKRRLNKTDMSDHHNRLSMPCNQVDESFLTINEKKKMENNEVVEAKVIVPTQEKYEEYPVSLKRTKAGDKSYSYAIGKPWNEIKKKSGFEEGMELDIRGYRGEDGELCFILQRKG